MSKGSITLEWAPDDGGRAETHLIVVYFFILPLKIWLDKHLVFPAPPDDIIKKRAYPTSDWLWGRGLSRRNGRCRTGDGAVSQFDCPDDIIKKRAYLSLELLWGRVYRVGMGAGGQWAAGEGVVDGAHGFRVVKIISRFRCSFFNRDVVVSGAKILTHHST